MLFGLLFAVLDAEELAGAFKGEARDPLAQRPGSAIEHVPAKNVAILGFGGLRPFGNLIDLCRGSMAPVNPLSARLLSICLIAMPGR